MNNKKDEEMIYRIAQARLRRLQNNSNQSLPLKTPFIAPKPHKTSKPRTLKKIETGSPKPCKINKMNRPKTVQPNRWFGSVFITGGIGDVFAVESFLTDQERDSLTTIYYATNKREPIERLFRSLKSFPNLKNHINVWDNFSNFWCFYSLEDYLTRSQNLNNFKKNVEKSKDLSIMTIFDQIKNKNLKYNGSSFLKEKLVDIDTFQLPENYIVLCPFSTDKRSKERDFNAEDWNQTLKFLEQKNIKGVVINSGNDIVPKNSYLIDLSNLTKIEEAVEIVKAAKGYLGIDSWLSVLAAKVFNSLSLQIKSVNSHCLNNAAFYYAPKKEFNFINTKINTKI
jgi:hypothetical protein